jgi:hypothetical protein
MFQLLGDLDRYPLGTADMSACILIWEPWDFDFSGHLSVVYTLYRTDIGAVSAQPGGLASDLSLATATYDLVRLRTTLMASDDLAALWRVWCVWCFVVVENRGPKRCG